MSVKDTKLEEKQQLVIKGAIFADEFRNRLTGQELAALSPETLEELEELLSNPEIKVGYYISDENFTKYIYVNEVPEDFSGNAIQISDDGFIYLSQYLNGANIVELEIGSYSITFYDNVNDETANMSVNGVNKVDIGQLTHSFNELDTTLKTIVEEAILDMGENGVSCSQEQWNVIKALLDKSLFINYSGYSLIKTSSDGISNYHFGLGAPDVTTVFTGVCYISFQYSSAENLLYGSFAEL